MQKCGVCGRRSVAGQVDWIACPECGTTICDGCKASVPFFGPLDAYFCSASCEAGYVKAVVDRAVGDGNLSLYEEEPKAVGGAFGKAYYTPARLEHRGHKLYFWMADGYPQTVKNREVRAECERFAAACEKSAKKA